MSTKADKANTLTVLRRNMLSPPGLTLRATNLALLPGPSTLANWPRICQPQVTINTSCIGLLQAVPVQISTLFRDSAVTATALTGPTERPTDRPAKCRGWCWEPHLGTPLSPSGIVLVAGQRRCREMAPPTILMLYPYFSASRRSVAYVLRRRAKTTPKSAEPRRARLA